MAIAIAALGSVPVLAQPASLPVLTKSFSAGTIPPGGSTVLTFSVSNPAGNSALSNVGFTDTLPSGLVVGAVPSVGGTCANAAAATIATAGSSTITVQNLDVPPGSATCTMTVNVTNAPGQFNGSCALFPAAFTNASGNVSVSNVDNGIQPSCLVVTPPETASQPVPTLSVSMLALLGLALGAAAIRILRG
jgi:uncharacterized repeat protein (TIGR01451 family)